ncbi:MAG: transcription factor FapR [Desulfitobacterium sp.]|nr:transcription factor FapR [Desulfitobacterium sp.]
MTRHHKHERHLALREEIENNPFSTDEQLARRFGVSVSTIRLDRAELGIPELQERTRAVAKEAYGTLKSLGEAELIGELRELRIGEEGTTVLKVEESMVLTKARVTRGHHLFAQANSLAIALVDAEIVVTGSVDMKFMRPVHFGEIVSAHGKVVKNKDNKYWIEITSKVDDEVVLAGNWIVFALDKPAQRKGAN